MMSTITRRSLFGLFSALLLLLALCWLIIDTTPVVRNDAGQQINDADTVSELLLDLKRVTQQRFDAQQVTLRTEQINSLLGFVQRAIPEFSGQLDGGVEHATLKASYRLQVGGLNGYINLTGQLHSAHGIRLSDVRIGSLTVPGEVALWLIKTAINLRTASQLGDQAINQVSKVEVDANHVTVSLVPIHDFLMDLNTIQNGLTGSQDEELKLRVTYYLRFLSELAIPQHRPGLSLSDFLVPLFQEVRNRTASGNEVEQNEAAILALAIYTGHHRLANFVGDVQPQAGRVVLPRYRPTLSNRSDLTQHFVISAAIKILSQQGISAAIGEFKELMDRAEGGSGFSFADLAADIAGIEFALMATDPTRALELQHTITSGIDESDYFPTVQDLPEGLSKEEFNQQYHSVEGEPYLAVVAEIEQRISQLPLYQ